MSPTLFLVDNLGLMLSPRSGPSCPTLSGFSVFLKFGLFTWVVGHKGPVNYAPFSCDGHTWHAARGRASLPLHSFERFNLIVETLSLRLLR